MGDKGYTVATCAGGTTDGRSQVLSDDPEARIGGGDRLEASSVIVDEERADRVIPNWLSCRMPAEGTSRR